MFDCHHQLPFHLIITIFSFHSNTKSKQTIEESLKSDTITMPLQWPYQFHDLFRSSCLYYIICMIPFHYYFYKIHNRKENHIIVAMSRTWSHTMVIKVHCLIVDTSLTCKIIQKYNNGILSFWIRTVVRSRILVAGSHDIVIQSWLYTGAIILFYKTNWQHDDQTPQSGCFVWVFR